jgi:choline monooxygenase
MFPTTVSGLPVLVVLDTEGELRAFLNVCRHRGTILVEEPQVRGTIQCPYHAWTYGLDGSLRGAPRTGGEPGFDPDGLGLVPAQAATWGPFVFVNLDVDAPALTEALGDLPDAVAANGLDVASLRFHTRVRYALRANWKIAVENYLECYHCAVAHPSFSEVIDVRPDRYLLEPHPTFGSHYASPRTPSANGNSEVAGQFHLIWPNIKVNVMPGRANLSVGPLVPTGTDTTDGFLDYFFGPDCDPDWIADYLKLDYQVGDEDRVLVESVQRGMRSGAFERGQLMLPSEQLIGAFQRWVAARLNQRPSRRNDSSQVRE